MKRRLVTWGLGAGLVLGTVFLGLFAGPAHAEGLVEGGTNSVQDDLLLTTADR